jgi:hypothetical protein
MERAVGRMARRSFTVMPEEEGTRLVAVSPTLDVDPPGWSGTARRSEAWPGTTVPGLVGRAPGPVVWAEGGLVVAGKLLRANQDARFPVRQEHRRKGSPECTPERPWADLSTGGDGATLFGGFRYGVPVAACSGEP